MPGEEMSSPEGHSSPPHVPAWSGLNCLLRRISLYMLCCMRVSPVIPTKVESGLTQDERQCSQQRSVQRKRNLSFQTLRIQQNAPASNHCSQKWPRGQRRHSSDKAKVSNISPDAQEESSDASAPLPSEENWPSAGSRQPESEALEQLPDQSPLCSFFQSPVSGNLGVRCVIPRGL